MAELLPDVWIEDPREFQDTVGRRHRSRRPQVTGITVWLECFARMAAVLSLKYPDKASELWVYQATVLRAARNYKGISWVTYDRQYRREALARRDLNWSAVNSRLYNEAFTGRAKAISRCEYCLSDTHLSANCPYNPRQHPDYLNPPTLQSSSLMSTPANRTTNQEICRRFMRASVSTPTAGTCTSAKNAVTPTPSFCALVTRPHSSQSHSGSAPLAGPLSVPILLNSNPSSPNQL